MHFRKQGSEIDGEAVATAKMSRQRPTKRIGKDTVAIETELPEDRLRGYRSDNTVFTGANARAALVGRYEKRNRKRFPAKSGGGSSRSY